MSQYSKKNDRLLLTLSMALAVIGTLSLAGCSSNNKTTNSGKPSVPAKRFDLSHWKLTMPTDNNADGKVDNISVAALKRFSDPDFFYVDEKGHMVFTSPNRAATTKNSKNTRSELRYMLRGGNTSLSGNGTKNNFALASRADAHRFSNIGGKMEATLHVDHVSRNSNRPNHSSSYSAVIGQIHAIKYKNTSNGFGYGNEPLKIFYKKWPNHETGSVYWNYERNLEKDDPKRKDVSYLVWGNSKRDSTNPGQNGIALGEEFSYTVNVYNDTMYLTFESEKQGTVHHQINLANNVDANGKIDTDDNPQGYTGDGHYFKAGVYNQCRAALKKNEAEAPCQGTGDWAIDKARGDYAQVSFSRLVVTDSEPQSK